MTPPNDASDAPSSLSDEEKRELFRVTLAAVSRSFYLTLRFLPPAVQQPMALGYLLARLSDTVADSASAPVPERLELLHRMEAVLAGKALAGTFVSELERLIPFIPDAGERRLLEQAPALFLLYRELDEADRHDVAWVLEVILSGQRLDLERFAGAGEGHVAALEREEELDDYTWRVAGCVGEFWTRVCFRHLPEVASLPKEEMVRLGVGFGKALQLINILRDAPEDLRAGRCYLPREQLTPHDPTTLLTQPEAARLVVAGWERRCEEGLAMGCRYVDALGSRRLRFACFLPWAIARRTLLQMRERPPLETADRVKISRAEVRRIAGWGLLAAVFPGAMARITRKVG